MVTLESDKNKKKKKKLIKMSTVILVLGVFLNIYLSKLCINILEAKFQIKSIPKYDYSESLKTLFSNKEQLQIYILLNVLVLLYIFMILTKGINKVSNSKTMIVAGNIEIPIAVGEGQHGTSRFMKEGEIKNKFHIVEYKKNSDLKISENVGFVLGMMKKKDKELILCVKEDINTIILGSTRSGKTRRSILQTIWLKGKTNSSLIVTDPKGELYLYTKKYLEENGFNVIAFDIRTTNKSAQYNYLQSIIDAVDDNDIPKAIDYTWDIVSSLVGIPKGEPLWTNGEAATEAAAILSVVLEAPKDCRNMANVYYFLAYMCKENEQGVMPITEYFNSLPDDHPAKTVFAMAEISPEKMRGSFFGSALATLRLFTNQNIAELTSRSDFNLKDIGRKKTALFLIIPDEKTTLYSLVSLFVNQAYVSLVELANENGNRLPLDCDFLLDELGNFPTIMNFGSMTSVGAGRGIRISIVIQDYQQLEKHYKEDFKNIKGNCQLTVYLKTPSIDTLEELSKRVGSYTVQTNNISSSTSGKKGNNDSYSSSASTQKRPLLFPEEIGRIESPYSLVLSTGNFPAIIVSPDFSNYFANSEMGMGNQEHNKQLLIERENQRPIRETKEVKLWGIWKEVSDKEKNINNNTENTRVSFLDLDFDEK